VEGLEVKNATLIRGPSINFNKKNRSQVSESCAELFLLPFSVSVSITFLPHFACILYYGTVGDSRLYQLANASGISATGQHLVRVEFKWNREWVPGVLNGCKRP